MARVRRTSQKAGRHRLGGLKRLLIAGFWAVSGIPYLLSTSRSFLSAADVFLGAVA